MEIHYRYSRIGTWVAILNKEDKEKIRKSPSAVSILLIEYWSFLDFENLYRAYSGAQVRYM